MYLKFRGRIWLKAWLDSGSQISLSRICLSSFCSPHHSISYFCFPVCWPYLQAGFLLMVVEIVPRVTSCKFTNPHEKKKIFSNSCGKCPKRTVLAPSSSHCVFLRQSLAKGRECSSWPILMLYVHLMAEDKVSSTILHGLNYWRRGEVPN